MIHPTAVVAARDLGADVSIGPYAVVGADVSVGDACVIGSHSVIEGRTTIGARTTIGPHAIVGAPPQLRGQEPAGELVIGADNTLRELCTVHLGSDGGRTTLGDANLLMAYAHVAHDCRLGDGVELANGVQLAGHVEVGDGAVIGGLAAVHQFTRVGTGAFVAAGAMVAQDVPPYCQVAGDRARLYGLNLVGLRRRRVSLPERQALDRALQMLYLAPLLREGLEAIEADAGLRSWPSVMRFVAFARASRRGLCRMVGRGADDLEASEDA